MTVGRMDPNGYVQKNVETVALGVAALKRRNPAVYARFELTVVGDGPMRPVLEEFVRRAGVEEAIRLVPALDHGALIRLVAQSSAALLLSRYEGHSMFLAEAMACGVPLIVSEGTGASHLVAAGTNGWRVDPCDPRDLAEAVVRLAGADTARLRSESRRIYAERFGREAILDAFDGVFASVASRGHRTP